MYGLTVQVSIPSTNSTRSHFSVVLKKTTSTSSTTATLLTLTKSTVLTLVWPAASDVPDNHNTSIVSPYTHIARVHRSLTSVRAACISDQAHKNPHCTTAVTSPTKSVRPFSFLASQPVITKDLAFPSADPTPLPPPNAPAKLERATMAPHGSSSPPPPSEAKSSKTWMTRKSLCDISGDAVFYSNLETGRS